jgi:hypothetical protein
MSLSKYALVIDGVTTTASGSPQYSATANVQNFKSVLVYVKEDNTNAIKFTVEARASNHAKAPWETVVTVQTVATNGSAIITVTDFADLEGAWFEIRIKYYDSVDNTHGKVYAWINRRIN